MAEKKEPHIKYIGIENPFEFGYRVFISKLLNSYWRVKFFYKVLKRPYIERRFHHKEVRGASSQFDVIINVGSVKIGKKRNLSTTPKNS